MTLFVSVFDPHSAVCRFELPPCCWGPTYIGCTTLCATFLIQQGFPEQVPGNMMTVLGKVDVDSLFGLLWNAEANGLLCSRR